LKINSLTRQKRTEVIIYLRATSSASGCGPYFAAFPAKQKPSKKPHSFPDIEAETAIAKPPYAHKRSRAHPLFLYFALFANPVKSIFEHLISSKLSSGSPLLKSL